METLGRYIGAYFRVRPLLLVLCFFFGGSAFSQEREVFRVLFWNVENLFDTERDSLKQDQEFLPVAVRGWNTVRYKKKLDHIAQVITAAGEWSSPALVGLCEVENDKVLRHLTKYSPLKAHDYSYVITDSPDLRGIDVALLYQRDQFKLLEHTFIRPDMGAGERPTRDILHVTGLIPTRDTLDVFVVHFPSRSGGVRESEPKRMLVAGELRGAVDSLIRIRQEPRILIMGDFNDYPDNRSIKEVLAVRLPDDEADESVLYHLLHRKAVGGNKSGSYKYQGEWGLLDHLIVSGNLLNKSTPFYTEEAKAEVLYFPFLLTEDEKYGGYQPFRTYNGMRYQGGYSDHLPVRLDLEIMLNVE